MAHVTTQRKKQSRALKLLSLDGGGVRGQSSLLILRELMRSLNRGRANPTEPWQEFDLIGGTSTGGLLAIMLGRLRMSIARVREGANGKFHEQPLEEILQQKIKEAGLDADAVLEDVRPDSCKVFVCATQVLDNSPTLLRSYDNAKVFGDITDVKIWEAGRATSAASAFFDPVTIGHMGEKFADGALHYNNPIELVLQESLELWPDSDRVLISIGTGSAPGQTIDSSLKALVSQLVRITTETEETARKFLRSHGDMVRANRLFRFNVTHGLGEIGLDESKEMPMIAARTRTYLRDPEITLKAIACVVVLKENAGTFANAEPSSVPEPLSESSDDSVNSSHRETQAGALDFLRNNPHFQQLRALIQQQPDMLKPILAQLDLENPLLVKVILQHPEELLDFLNEDEDEDNHDVQPSSEGLITATEDEARAIERLCNLGFPRADVVQTYFACDKNEELALKFLLEGPDSEEYNSDT